MNNSSTDQTAPLPLPTQRKGHTGYRTNLVANLEEKQLKLDWTEPSGHAHDAPEEMNTPLSDGIRQTEVAIAPSAIDVVRRAYPLAYDAEGPAGEVLQILARVRDLSASTIVAYNEGDIATVGSHLPMIAALLAKAYPHTEFNPSLGAAISFMRRATLFADATQCGLGELMVLAKAARILAESPLISLDESAELVMELEARGWIGADPAVVEFVTALFGDSPESAETNPQMQSEVKGSVS